MQIEDHSKERSIEKITALTRELELLKENEAKHILTEKNLIKSKATAHAFLNATSDLAALLDTDGIILEVNEAGVRRVGKSISELAGKCIFDFFPQEFKDIRRVYINIVQQTREPLRFQYEFMGLILFVCIYPIINNENEVEKLAVFVNDNTEHRRSEDRLYRYSRILSTIQDPMAYIDKHFIFRTVNNAYLHLYNKKSRKEISGHPVEELLGNDFTEKKIKWNIQKCLAGEIVQQQEWFDFPDGKRRCMYMSYYPLRARDEKVLGVVLHSIDITKIKELEEELRQLSVTDRLTRIFNRMKFEQSLKEEIKRLKRYNTELSVIMFDIDFFKQINDTHGHDVGDKVMVSLTDLVKNYIRDTDTFCRWGGEEFMILLPHTSLDNAVKLAERIRIKIMTHKFAAVETVTCSFGVSEFNEKDDEETFTKRVDNALYESKRTGRNKVTQM